MAVKRTHNIGLSELREAWFALRSGQNPIASQSERQDYVNKMRRSGHLEWEGASPADVDKWLTEGYSPEGERETNLEGITPPSHQPMLAYDEEIGTLLLEDAYAGSDMPYIRWENVEAKRGLKIKAIANFNASTNAKVISEYGDWLVRLIEAAERMGISASLDILYTTQHLMTNDGDSDVTEILINAKREGEILDPHTWRALLSPAGFRTLGFLAYGLTGEHLNLQCRSSLGRATGNEWRAIFNDEADELVIESPNSPRYFPEDALLEGVEKVIKGMVI